MGRGNNELDASDVQFTYIENAPPITIWLEERIADWLKVEFGLECEVKIVQGSKPVQP